MGLWFPRYTITEYEIYRDVLKEYRWIILASPLLPFLIVWLGWFFVYATSSEEWLDHILPHLGKIPLHFALFARWADFVMISFIVLFGFLWAILFIISVRKKNLPFPIKAKNQKAIYFGTFFFLLGMCFMLMDPSTVTLEEMSNSTSRGRGGDNIIMYLHPITYSIAWIVCTFTFLPLFSIIILGIYGYFVTIARFFKKYW